MTSEPYTTPKAVRIEKAIFAKWIVPVTESKGNLKVLENSVIGIDQGQIIFVGDRDEFRTRYLPDTEIVREGNHIVIPGLINTHTHLGMQLLKGKFDDFKLDDWLQNIWPSEGHFLRDPERRLLWVYNGALLALYESLLEGVTTINDMYTIPEPTEDAAKTAGVRVFTANGLLDYQDGTVEDEMNVVYEGLKAGAKVMSLHSLYTTSPKMTEIIAEWRKEFPDVIFHIHANETQKETQMQIDKYGDLTVCQKLDQMGCLNDRSIAAHMVHISEDDIQLCGKNKMNVSHCPRSNLKLASGIAPIAAMMEAGMNVTLGTDSACSNNALSILDECSTACLVAKVKADSADVVTCHDALRMATRNGAKAVGLENKIGTLEVGKEADIAIVDLTPGETFHPITTEPISHLIYTTKRMVTDTFRAGNHLVDNGVVKSFKLDRQKIAAINDELDRVIIANKGKTLNYQS